MSAIQQILVAGADPYRGFTGGSVDDAVVSPANANASVTMVTDGTVTTTGSSPVMMTQWYAPTTAGIGTTHWVRATVTSGTLSSGTTGTFLQLNANRSWSRTQTVIGSSAVTFTLDLATDSGGTNIVKTCTCTLTAEKS